MTDGTPEVEEIGPEEDQGAEAFRPKPKSETSKSLMAIRAGGRVRAIIPDGIDQLYTMSKMIHASRLAPRGLDTPDKIAVAVMFGAEIGLPPMASLQGIAVINGRPAVWGPVAMALVRDSGQLMSIKEWIDGEGDEMTGHCEVKRRGEEKKHFTFSMDEAKRAGLTSKKDTPWQTYPQRMLIHRARGWAWKDVFPDILLGLPTVEEAQDMEPIDITPAQIIERSGLASRLPGTAATGGFGSAEIDAEVAAATPEAEPEPDPPKWSDEQRRAINNFASILLKLHTPIELKALQFDDTISNEEMSDELRTHLRAMYETRLAEVTEAD